MSEVSGPAPESSEEPSAEELDKPSTEKDPGQEPTSPATDEDEADHEAVGIGIIDGQETPN